MAEFKIPKKFKLLGMTIKVVWSATLLHDESLLGKVDYDACTITLQSRKKGNAWGRQVPEVTFMHELTHLVFQRVGDSGGAFDPPLHQRERV